MNILNVILYNKNGETNNIEFSPNKINLIIGGSDTGKSALIQIIDYCLGKDNKSFTVDIATHKVIEWYAIYIKIKDKNIFIARQKSNQEKNIFLMEMQSIDNLPLIDEIYGNTNQNELKEYLANNLGIIPFESLPNDEDEVNNKEKFSLSKCYDIAQRLCMQPYSIINTTTQYFYTEDKRINTESIKTLLPYFLGIYTKRYFDLLKQKDETKANLINIKNGLLQKEFWYNQKRNETISLIQSAKTIGFTLDTVNESTSTNLLLETLKIIESAENIKIQIQNNDELLLELQEKNANKSNELLKIRTEISNIRTLKSQINDYKQKHLTHDERLKTVKLYDIEENAIVNSCPLCNTALDTEIPSVKNINNALHQINTELNLVPRELSNFERRESELKNKITELKEEQKIIENQINVLINNKTTITTLQNIELEKYSKSAVASHLIKDKIWEEKDSIDKLRTKKINIELNLQTISSNIKTEKKTQEESKKNILGGINRNIVENAKQINWQEQNKNLKFKLNELYVYSVDSQKKEDGVGTGRLTAKNLHVLLSIALHSHFYNEKLPVPHFIVFEDLFKEIGNENIKNIEDNPNYQLLNLLIKTIKNVSFGFQIICIDEKKDKILFDIKDSDIKDIKQDNVNYIDWLNGDKLIPSNWL